MNRMFTFVGALATFIIAATGLYLAYRLTVPGVIAIIAVLVAGLMLHHKRAALSFKWPFRRRNTIQTLLGSPRAGLLIGGVILGDLAMLLALVLSRSVNPLQSPWVAVPGVLFALFGLTTWLLLMLLDEGWSAAAKAAVVLHGAVLFGVLEIVYAYGFGFDPFIHRATEDYIAAHGYITPKQPFYNGQYVVVVALHWLSGLSVDLVDRLLVPVLAAVTLPFFAMDLARSRPMGEQVRGWAPLAWVLLPFLPLTFTIPNNLVYLMLIWVLCLLPRVATSRAHQALALLIAGAALATHPLLGTVILLLALAPRAVARYNWRASLVLFGAAAGALPAFFVLNNWRHGDALVIGGNPFARLELFLGLFRQAAPVTLDGRLDALTPLYAYATALPWLGVVAATVTTWWLWRRGERLLPLVIWPVVLGVVVAVFVMSTEIWVPGVISWEQGEFSSRLLDAMGRLLTVLWLPLAVVAVDRLAPVRARLARAVALAAIAVLITASWWLTYPQANAHVPNLGWGIGEQHWAAVDFVAEQARGTKYVVLSDQMVSVAALRRFGFTDLPYAIPTGGRLYEHFLDMAHGRTARVVADEAMAEFNVDSVYFINNDYYADANYYLDRLAGEADHVWRLADNRVTVFEFQRH